MFTFNWATANCTGCAKATARVLRVTAVLLNYRFEPKEVEQGTVSDAEVLFIYDNQVKENCYLLPQAEGVWAEGCSTMLLQSHKDEDVNIILEFENKSGEPFSCIDGMVYPDTRFYMIGRVEATLYNPDFVSAEFAMIYDLIFAVVMLVDIVISISRHIHYKEYLKKFTPEKAKRLITYHLSLST